MGQARLPGCFEFGFHYTPEEGGGGRAGRWDGWIDNKLSVSKNFYYAALL
jgi:hypothetical protein